MWVVYVEIFRVAVLAVALAMVLVLTLVNVRLVLWWVSLRVSL